MITITFRYPRGGTIECKKKVADGDIVHASSENTKKEVPVNLAGWSGAGTVDVGPAGPLDR
jgi:hypothetical protein